MLKLKYIQNAKGATMKIIKVRSKTPAKVLQREGFKRIVNSSGENERYQKDKVIIFVKNGTEANFADINLKRKELSLEPIYPGVVYYQSSLAEESLFFRKYIPVPEINVISEESRMFFEEISIPKSFVEFKKTVCKRLEKEFNTIPIFSDNKIYFTTPESMELELKEGKLVIEVGSEKIEFEHFSVEGTQMYLFKKATDYVPLKTIDI